MTTLGELFPDEDYRFRLTLRRGEPRAFFAPGPDAERVLAERARWLAQDPARYAALQPEGVAAFGDWCRMMAGWGIDAGADVGAVGAALEPDFLLMVRDANGVFRLRGGALCFPTGWALEEKLGGTMREIHGVVPRLNAALGGPVDQFLDRLRPGAAMLRANWGLAATDELNLHPALARPRLTATVPFERLWLRVERQALAALPATGAVLFGIRVELHPLAAVRADPELWARFGRALATMPDDVAVYKGLAAVRPRLLAAMS